MADRRPGLPRNNLTKTEANAIQKIAEQIMESAEYGASRAFFKSWSGSSSFGSGARERLLKYRTRLNNHQGVVKNVYCSELVILAVFRAGAFGRGPSRSSTSFFGATAR